MEDVWSYPRPPALLTVSRHIRIEFAGRIVASTRAAYRVLETSHPPVYYLPRDSFQNCTIEPAPGGSFCEWKGMARYWSISAGESTVESFAWSYESPTPAFEAIRGHLALYAGKMGGCFIDDERVEPQPGGFYGGWITQDLIGPFKGIPGSQGW